VERQRAAAARVDLTPPDPLDVGPGVAARLGSPIGAVRTRLMSLPPFTRRSILAPRMRRVLGRFGLAAAVAFIFVWSVAPFLWLVLMSLERSADLVRTPPTVIPGPLTFENYRFVLFPPGVSGGQSSVEATRVPFGVLNSFIVAVCVTAINLVLGSIAGYAYSRATRSRLMRGTLWALMLTRMTPSLALILPFFLVFKWLGLIDTRTGLVIAYCSLILPLAIWMMKGYFDGLPPNLEKAALVDGCTRLQAIRKIVLPVARPGLVAAGIFCFLVSWNEFIFALILTGTPSAQTIPVIISGFLAQLRFYDYGPMFAASVLAVIPPVVIALAFQGYLVRGMLSGSIKG
ncbi:MAG: carbohydrate ABC transporter permease, partial [Methylobacteriaceae bacterium]|nr:carbohydrate ABC transporter permease [Methylobacteriaceae bacterium]MBV9247236.1 carbohydrate ABC transporter permease [Methylobacteriaceae bacterium]